MQPLAVPLLAALAAWGAAGAPAPLVFPDSWGSPPEVQTEDWQHLPGGYGYGSSSLIPWINGHMKDDVMANRVQYPPAFGEPPRKQTRDLRKLPFGYGFGSGTVAAWLALRAREVYGEPGARADLPPVHGLFGHAAEPRLPAKAAPPPEFPTSWGPVPKAQSRDYVPLAGGYGHGSGTVSKWILSHIEQDRQAGKLQFPPAFGRPPMIETADYGPLPFGYGHGSSTLASWLKSKAMEVYREEAGEYKGFHGSLRYPEEKKAGASSLGDSIFSM